MKNPFLYAIPAALFLGASMTSCTLQVDEGAGLNPQRAIEIARTDKVLPVYYSAALQGRQDVEIRPQVSGLIAEIRIHEGENVRKGQTLFVIEQAAYQAALETAEANVAAAQAEVATARLTAESKRELHTQEVISRHDLQTAEHALLRAEAQLAQAIAQRTGAENDLSYTVIQSPVDGIAGKLPYRVGALVDPSISTPLTTLSDNSEIHAYFSLNENQVLSLVREYGGLAAAIAAMPEVGLQLGDGSTYESPGHIDTISGVIERNTGTVNVRAVFPNSGQMLLSGGAGRIVYPRRLEDVIVVPQAATYEIQDKVFVYKVVDLTAEATEVEVYPVNDGSTYVVLAGLAEGDVIVAEGAGLLRNGAEVIPVMD